jgi:hypothetical protein
VKTSGLTGGEGGIGSARGMRDGAQPGRTQPPIMQQQEEVHITKESKPARSAQQWHRLQKKVIVSFQKDSP